VKLLEGFLLRLFGHARFFDTLAQIFHLGLLVFAAEFLVNRFDLLVEVILLLRFLHLPLDARLNRPVKLSFIHFDFEQFDEPLETTVRREYFQQPLFVFDRDAQLRGERVGQVRRVLIAQGGLQRVRLGFGGEAQVLFDECRDALHERFKARPRFGDDGGTPHRGGKRPVIVIHPDGRRALASLDDHFGLAVFLALRLKDARDGADAVNLIGRRLINRSVMLRREKDRAVGRQSLFQGAHRPGTADLERDFGEGKDDDVADWDHRIARDVRRCAI
jgi:hypothetical protein